MPHVRRKTECMERRIDIVISDDGMVSMDAHNLSRDQVEVVLFNCLKNLDDDDITDDVDVILSRIGRNDDR